MDMTLIIKSIESHYNDPTIAPNGKAEGLCLAIRGLKGIETQITSIESENVELQNEVNRYINDYSDLDNQMIEARKQIIDLKDQKKRRNMLVRDLRAKVALVTEDLVKTRLSLMTAEGKR